MVEDILGVNESLRRAAKFAIFGFQPYAKEVRA
jgi:hypothetical protein